MLRAGLAPCVLLAAIAALAADRGPSTPEERKQAVAIIRRFEDNPMNPALKPQIQWVLNWTREVPDIRLNLCASFFKLHDAGSKNGETLFDAMVFAQTAFVLENPQQQDDGLAQVQAGVEGVLHAYELLLKANSNDRQAYLDKLIKLRQAGTLAQFVKKHASASCSN
jgi:hypothetical protein